MIDKFRKQDTLAHLKTLNAMEVDAQARLVAMDAEKPRLEAILFAIKEEKAALEVKDLPTKMASRVIGERMKAEKKNQPAG